MGKCITCKIETERWVQMAFRCEVCSPEVAVAVVETPTEPVQYKDCWCPTAKSRTDFGTDAKGRACERKHRMQTFTSEGGDSIRDASAGRTYDTGNLVAGEWRLV